MRVRSLALESNGHQFMFRYAAGREEEVLDQIVALAEDSTCALDWVDAATLSFQVAQQSAADCCEALVPWSREG
jgi:hypothetical protein